MLVVGRVDGSARRLSAGARRRPKREQPLVPLAEVPPEVDYGPQPPLDKLPKVAEVEPNDEPSKPRRFPRRASRRAQSRRTPCAGQARTAHGACLLLTTTSSASTPKPATSGSSKPRPPAAGSPLDTKIEVLDASGQPVPRLLLRAVRDTVIEFRGMNSEQRGVRLANWEEMLLNEYVYLSGDVIKLFQQRRGPDADAQFYPENGNRFAFFDTTSRAHALGEPAYIVVPYAVGTELPNNGLPVFTRQLRERRRRAAQARQGFAADVRRAGRRHVSGPRHRRPRLLRATTTPTS